MGRIRLTFLIPEEQLQRFGESLVNVAPETATPLKKDVAKMIVDKMIKGQDESFRTIDPQYTPNAFTEIDTLGDISYRALLHKFSELVIKQCGGNDVTETKEIMEKILDKYL